MKFEIYPELVFFDTKRGHNEHKGQSGDIMSANEVFQSCIKLSNRTHVPINRFSKSSK